MIDKNELKRLVDSVLNDRRFCGDENHKALADGVLALLAEVERLSIREDVLENLCDARFRINLDLEAERDKLKAENGALRIALEEIRENSTDICACEFAADALVDASNSKGDKP